MGFVKTLLIARDNGETVLRTFCVRKRRGLTVLKVARYWVCTECLSAPCRKRRHVRHAPHCPHRPNPSLFAYSVHIAAALDRRLALLETPPHG